MRYFVMPQSFHAKPPEWRNWAYFQATDMPRFPPEITRQSHIHAQGYSTRVLR